MCSRSSGAQMRGDIRWPDVILVNGPSSAGKSTLGRSLQAKVPHPYLCVGFDDFVFFSAPRYYHGADTGTQSQTDNSTAMGVEMVTTSLPGAPTSVKAVFGPVFQRIIDSMAPAVRTLVDGGNSVIFDHVLHDANMYRSCEAAFHGLSVFKVGVTCRIDVLEAREAARGDRVIGRARGLAEVVHRFCDYDVRVDTSVVDAAACTDEVAAALVSWSGANGKSP
jgi:chloramphenicol 3-O phosphotransferase